MLLGDRLHNIQIAIPKGCVNHSWSMVALLMWRNMTQGITRKKRKKVYPGALTLDQFAALCVDTVIHRYRVGKARREARDEAEVTIANNRKFARKGR
jgi:hypothetical protein